MLIFGETFLKSVGETVGDYLQIDTLKRIIMEVG